MGMLKTAAFISLPILGICATVLYLLYKKEEDDLHETLQDVKTSRMKTIEMKIPNSVVGVLIGRAGVNIKDIQEKTDTRINFKDNEVNEEYRTCHIRGTAEAAQMAESLIHEFITTQPIIEVRETWVPTKAVGRIIGRRGENIRSISRASNAKVNVDSSSSENIKGAGGDETRVIVKGTTEQIAVALSMIQEKVEIELEERRKMEFCQSNRSPRNRPGKSSLTASPLKNTEKQKLTEKFDVLTATGSDGFIKVFVSSVVNPSRFWIQVVNHSAVELDRLLAEMTEYYSAEENRTIHSLKEVSIGQMVAAPYPGDDKWYRAEVKSIKINNSDNNETQVDVYYVDYGDSEYLNKSDIYQLRTDFLKLRFQAIECSLAKIQPSEGEEWNAKIFDVFADLVHCAEWKPLFAKVISCDQQPRGRREGSPVPSLSLFDATGPEFVDIGEELVKQGFAVKDDSSHNSSVSSPSHRSVNGASSPTPTTTPQPTTFLRRAASPDLGSDTDSNL